MQMQVRSITITNFSSELPQQVLATLGSGLCSNTAKPMVVHFSGPLKILFCQNHPRLHRVQFGCKQIKVLLAHRLVRRSNRSATQPRWLLLTSRIATVRFQQEQDSFSRATLQCFPTMENLVKKLRCQGMRMVVASIVMMAFALLAQTEFAMKSLNRNIVVFVPV
jgi:hypothetical protein